MTDLCILMFCFGGFCLIISIGYYFFGILMYALYKANKGKMKFWDYMKRWK